MEMKSYAFNNEIELRVVSGDTGKTLSETTVHNDISDDLLAQGGSIYLNGGQSWIAQVSPVAGHPWTPAWTSQKLTKDAQFPTTIDFP